MRKFGVELEISNVSMAQALAALREAEVPTSGSTSYRHDGYSEWKVMHDQSVRNGCEVVSRILSGPEGVEEVKKVCRALIAQGATVNNTCGLHVHIDARDISAQHLRNIVERYSKFETEIDAFMPRSRRGSSNNFCMSMAPILNSVGRNQSARWGSDTVATVASTLGSRYLKVNLESYVRQRTIEFRHHSGSVNAGKVSKWIEFLQAFVKASEPSNNTNGVSNIEAPRRRGRARQLLPHGLSMTYTHRKLYNKLLDANGYTSVENLARCAGIASTSVPAYISAIRNGYGVTIRNSRSRGYMLVSTTTATSNSVTIATVPAGNGLPNDDSLWRNIPSHLVSFYTERAMELV